MRAKIENRTQGSLNGHVSSSIKSERATCETEGGIRASAFRASQKVYIKGARHPQIRVPVREISLTENEPRDSNGHALSRSDPPLRVYDTSGPYTDPEYQVDVSRGLPRTRLTWNASTERVHPSAKSGSNVTQMHFARRGIITPEMEFVAI